MQCTAGQVLIGKHVLSGGFGFTLQDSWVQHATLRDNILFGQPFDSQKYDAVVSACALQQDIKVFTSKTFDCYDMYCTCFLPHKNILLLRKTVINDSVHCIN